MSFRPAGLLLAAALAAGLLPRAGAVLALAQAANAKPAAAVST